MIPESEILRLCELPAGRELDEAVASHLLGWKEYHKPFAGSPASQFWTRADGAPEPKGMYQFSADIAAAAIVLDHAVAQGLPIEIYHEIEWSCRIGADPDTSSIAWAETLPLAICRAALEAALFAKKEAA